MRRHIGFTVFTAALLLGHAPEAAACSFAPFPSQRSDDVTYFLATAGADTLLAGAGTQTVYPDDPWRLEPLAVPERPVFGQVVSLGRIGGRLADSVRREAERFGGQVVVVPWSTRADCRRVVWQGEAQWSPPGRTGTYLTRLRAREHWVDGRPTFDASGESNPYGQESGADSVLTPERIFELYEPLPSGDGSGTAPLRAWLEANREAASTWLVQRTLRFIRIDTEYEQAARIVPPMQGTYRLTVTPTGGTPRELFIRTSSDPTPADPGDAGEPGSADPLSVDRVRRYSLHVHGAPRPEEIRNDNTDALQQPCSVGLVEVALAPSRIKGGGEVWKAHLDWGMMQRCFAADADVVRTLAVRLPWSGGGLPGRFRRAPDGTMRFEQELRSEGRVLLRIEGERVSGDVVR